MQQRPRMIIENVYAGICTTEYFHQSLITSNEMIAWMLIPPQSYQALLNEGWDAGFDRMREILDLPLHDSMGKLSIATANLVHKVWMSLDQRKHGAVVQRNMNVNLTGSDAKEVAQAMEQSSMEALDYRLKEINKKIKREKAEEKEAAEVDVTTLPASEYKRDE